MECEAVRRVLSDDDRRTVRSRRVRAHLRSCGGCRAFRAALVQRPVDLAALFPVVALPAVDPSSVVGTDADAAGAGGQGRSAGSGGAGSPVSPGADAG